MQSATGVDTSPGSWQTRGILAKRRKTAFKNPNNHHACAVMQEENSTQFAKHNLIILRILNECFTWLASFAQNGLVVTNLVEGCHKRHVTSPTHGSCSHTAKFFPELLFLLLNVMTTNQFWSSSCKSQETFFWPVAKQVILQSSIFLELN